MTPRYLVAGLAAAGMFAGAAPAERSPAAVQLLDQALEAHQPPGAKLTATIRYEGLGKVPTQDAIPLAPFRSYSFRRSVAVDEGESASVLDDYGEIAGFSFSSRHVNTPSGGFAVDHGMKTVRPSERRPSTYATVLPHARLAAVRETATVLELVPGSAGSDPRLRFVTPAGSGELTFDRVSKLLHTVEAVPSAGFYGEQRLSLRYPAYRRLGGTAVPESYVAEMSNPVLGAYETVMTLVEAKPEGPSAIDVATPAGVSPASFGWRGTALNRRLVGTGLHLIENVTDAAGHGTYNVLAVEFADHLIVIEAPISAAVNDKVLERLAAGFAGKPVRRLFLSHHHDDHVGGIEPYARRGIPISGTRDTVRLLERVRSERPADLGAVKLEAVSGTTLLSDRANELQVHEVTGTPHSEQMLVFYFPRQKLLYQVDYINEGDYAFNANSLALLDWIRHRGLAVDRIAGLHGQIVSLEDVETKARNFRQTSQ